MFLDNIFKQFDQVVLSEQLPDRPALRDRNTEGELRSGRRPLCWN